MVICSTDKRTKKPHFGQLSASLETILPQPLHFISAIFPLIIFQLTQMLKIDILLENCKDFPPAIEAATFSVNFLQSRARHQAGSVAKRRGRG